MLAYLLALAVGLASLGIYLAAFFLPEIHRKSDFYWSGVGLFYALVLWICAGRITGGVLLGQIAGVALLGWFGWQTLTLRRQLTPKSQQTDLPSTSEVKAQAESLTNDLRSKISNVSLPEGTSQVPQKVSGLFDTVKQQVGKTVDSLKKPKAKPTAVKPQKPATTTTKVTAAPTEVIPPKVEIISPAETGDKKSSDLDVTLNVETVPSRAIESSPETDTPELIRPNPPDPEIVEEALEDAEAKNLPASPPETAKPENPFDKIEKSGS